MRQRKNKDFFFVLTKCQRRAELFIQLSIAFFCFHFIPYLPLIFSTSSFFAALIIKLSAPYNYHYSVESIDVHELCKKNQFWTELIKIAAMHHKDIFCSLLLCAADEFVFMSTLLCREHTIHPIQSIRRKMTNGIAAAASSKQRKYLLCIMHIKLQYTD